MRVFAFLIFSFCLMLVTLVPAIALDPDEAVKTRQAIFKEIGKNMKQLGELAKTDPAAERDSVLAAVTKIRELAPQPWDYFGQETAVARVKTEAKASIWADPAGFRKAQSDFSAAVDALILISGKGDSKVLTEKINALGASCGACHKAFKD